MKGSTIEKNLVQDVGYFFLIAKNGVLQKFSGLLQLTIFGDKKAIIQQLVILQPFDINTCHIGTPKKDNGDEPMPTFTPAKIQLFSKTVKNILMKFTEI